MEPARQALADRIKTLRRRHFGQRGGAAAFAQKLDIPEDEYKSYERGTMPAGDMLVRICEATGEDLQWLLTGVAGRGAVVISSTRGRHQALLARLAQYLDENPERARPFESLLDLLVDAGQNSMTAAALPDPDIAELLPIYSALDAPHDLPDDDDPGGLVVHRPESLAECAWSRATLVEQSESASVATSALREIDVVRAKTNGDGAVQFARLPALVKSFPKCFAVTAADDAMTPRMNAGDAVIVAPGMAPRLGAPALIRPRTGPALVRVWLGEVDDRIHFAAEKDEQRDSLAAADVSWSLDVLYVLAHAA